MALDNSSRSGALIGHNTSHITQYASISSPHSSKAMSATRVYPCCNRGYRHAGHIEKNDAGSLMAT
jgi:hypothetical protein